MRMFPTGAWSSGGGPVWRGPVRSEEVIQWSLSDSVGVH